MFHRCAVGNERRRLEISERQAMILSESDVFSSRFPVEQVYVEPMFVSLFCSLVSVVLFTDCWAEPHDRLSLQEILDCSTADTLNPLKYYKLPSFSFRELRIN